jgi:hypothetical protein
MKKKYMVIVVALFLTLFTKLQAQTDSDAEMLAYYTSFKEQQTQSSSQLKAQPGTYQFFILGEDSTQLLRTDLVEKIESYRDEYAVVHLKLSSTTTIRILPCSEITSTRFTPINNVVVFQPGAEYPSATR